MQEARDEQQREKKIGQKKSVYHSNFFFSTCTPGRDSQPLPRLAAEYMLILKTAKVRACFLIGEGGSLAFEAEPRII